MIIDTHAHLSDKTLRENIEEFLRLAAEAQVLGVLTIGTTLESSRQCVELSERHKELRAAVGIHPNNCCEAESGDWEQIVELAKHPQVSAIGETGLDKYWDDCPWDVQVDYFQRHLELSHATQHPVVIHTRECAEETLSILREHASRFGAIRGVMHSFTGPQSVADGCLELGLHISFAGMATYKNANDIRAIAATIPEDRILVETDSPYLTPHPLRGKRPNHPALVSHTLRALAEVRGVSEAEFAASTTKNARRLFNAWL